jgi:hypothetical protein
MELKAGDIVKSFDFNGIEDCYMVGKVVSVSNHFGDFRAEFIKRVWEGNEDTRFKTDFFTAPLQGNLFTDTEHFPRIVVVA